MDNNTERLTEQIFSWLSSPANVDPASQTENIDWDWEVDTTDISSWEEDLDMAHPNPKQNASIRELPLGQHRYESLLKQKLATKIASRPPRFPWETEVMDYQQEPVTQSTQSLWQPQLAKLSFLVSLPEQVVETLFKQCLEAMTSLRPQGAKMVQAVQTLFPDQTPYLNQMTTRLLMSPSRSEGTLEQEIAQRWQGEYETATPAQQMVLSLMTAKAMIEALTVTLSPNHPQVNKTWETTMGSVTLEATYQGETTSVQVTLPQGGSLTWKTAQTTETVESETGGVLRVDLARSSTYALEIALANTKQPPLVFNLEIQ